MITSTDAGARKPSPRFFSYALARCGCASDDVLFVGNQLNTDVAGANSVGIRSVWLAGEAYRSDDDRPCDAEPTYTIQGLIELPGLLAGLPPSRSRIRAAIRATAGRRLRDARDEPRQRGRARVGLVRRRAVAKRRTAGA